jgi:phospholipase A1
MSLICYLFGCADLAAKESNFGQLKLLKLSFHKENYFYPFSRTRPNAREAVQSNELKYQFSLKMTPFQFGHSSFSLAYTQKAFWQAFDASRSRPIREINHNPEFFFKFGGANFFGHIGFEHESNGEEEPKSRSWDRLYLRLIFQKKNLRIMYKRWHVLAEELHGINAPERDGPMSKYYGHQELDIAIRLGTTVVKTYGRYALKDSKGYIQNMLLWPIGQAVFAGLSYSRGYGDSLRSYNINHESYGVGFFVNP